VVRGISKQVILIQGDGNDFYESAILLLKEDKLKDGVGDDELLRQAKAALNRDRLKRDNRYAWSGILCGIGGFLLSCGLWCLILLL
jgi:hypothetical protein